MDKFLGDRDHQAKVCLHELLLRGLRAGSPARIPLYVRLSSTLEDSARSSIRRRRAWHLRRSVLRYRSVGRTRSRASSLFTSDSREFIFSTVSRILSMSRKRSDCANPSDRINREIWTRWRALVQVGFVLLFALSRTDCRLRRSIWLAIAMTSDLRLAALPSVHSCWPGVTISSMGRFPVASSRRKADICWVTIAERDSAFSVLSCPRSMRLATSTSPQRVSRDMRPASRRYVRTRSLGSSTAPG